MTDKYIALGDGDLTPEQLDGMESWDRDVMLDERHRVEGAMLVRRAVAEIRRRRADDRPLPDDPRTLIAEGRKHDEALTPCRWHQIGYAVTKINDDAGGSQIATTNARHDAAGIAWLRNNLRAMLDGYAATLDEVERLRAETDKLRKVFGMSSEALLRRLEDL